MIYPPAAKGPLAELRVYRAGDLSPGVTRTITGTLTAD
jgi:hypothetical protein